MTWLRIDDGFAEHEKLLKLSRNDRWTWIELLCYCARQDSAIVPSRIRELLRYVTPGFVNKCIDVGLLDRDEHGILTVHDWIVYNPRDPTGALRQSRHRNAKRNASTRDDRNASRVGARAEPGPAPQDLNPGVSSRRADQPPDFKDIFQNVLSDMPA